TLIAKLSRFERTRAMAKRKSSKSLKRTKTARKRASARASVKRTAKRAAKRRSAARKAAAPKRKAAPKAKAPRPVKPLPNLDRVRRTLDDDTVPTPPSSLNMERRGSAARSGRAEMSDTLRKHGSSMSPRVTGGDVDADYENAYFSGDEAPG